MFFFDAFMCGINFQMLIILTIKFFLLVFQKTCPPFYRNLLLCYQNLEICATILTPVLLRTLKCVLFMIRYITSYVCSSSVGYRCTKSCYSLELLEMNCWYSTMQLLVSCSINHTIETKFPCSIFHSSF